jgi:streptogramin lyase
MGAKRLLYGIAQGAQPSGQSFALLFAFDARSRSFLDSIPLPEGAPMANSLQVGPDGAVWGLTSDVLFRLDAATRKLQVVVNLPGEFDIAGPMVGNTLYFATNHRLRALTLGGGPRRA